MTALTCIALGALAYLYVATATYVGFTADHNNDGDDMIAAALWPLTIPFCLIEKLAHWVTS